MSTRTQAYVNISALLHNVQQVRKRAPQSKLLAMVKANAYGHGLVAIGKLLNQVVDAFGVACLSEAIRLREEGVRTPIVVMSGIFTKSDVEQVTAYDLQIVVHDSFQVALLQTARIKAPISVWLKMDTGMHRLGFPPETFLQVYALLEKNPLISKPMVVITHLAMADELQKMTTYEQLSQFHRCTTELNCLKSAANSAGILAWPDAVLHWNRPGIMLYGVSPMVDKTGEAHDLQPVMTLKSKIIAVHSLRKGDLIGYGGQGCCPEDMPVGVVAIGYGDGYPRHAKNGTPVLINGILCPLIGRVSMDLITVDLRLCPQAKVGHEVTLWGKGLPVEQVASWADTIAYQLLCNVSERVVFLYQ
jgi:alanine racemase